MKSIIIIILILFAVALLNAQPDNIKDEILGYHNTNQLEIINKSRRMLLDKFEDGDIQKVKEIKDYLLNDNSFKGYMPLYFNERFCIMFWTREYAEIFRQIKLWDSINNIQIEKPKNWQEKIYGEWARFIYPAEDLLAEKLRNKSKDSAISLRNEFNKAPLTQQEKDLLNMLFIRFTNEYSDELQDSLNNLADAYIQNYPANITLPYVRNVLRKKYVEELGGSFSLGIGYNIPTNPMSEYYNDMPGFYMNYKSYIKRSIIFGNLAVGFGKNKIDLEDKGNYLPVGYATSLVRVGLGYGYDLLDAKKISLYPTIDIGYTWFGPDSSKQYYLEAFDRNSFSYSPGIAAEYRLPTTFINPVSLLGISFNFNYNYLIHSKKDRFLSNMHYFGVGIGFYTVNKFRDL